LASLGKYLGWNLPRIERAHYCLGIYDKEGCARQISIQLQVGGKDELLEEKSILIANLPIGLGM